MKTTDILLFVVLPYLALLVFIVGSIHRYRSNGFKVTSLSSQFLENKKLFWGSVPFHFGIVFLFFGHLTAFLFPKAVLAWNGEPLRLLILELTGFSFGILALIGITGLIVRRLTTPRIRVVTSVLDIIILLLLLAEIILGLTVAYYHRWGSSWFASSLTPYLQSIFTFSPQTAVIAAMPALVKWHVALAYVIVLLIPFSRLMHLLVFPLGYMWRPYQKVVWYWNHKRIRKPEGALKNVPPRNN